MSPEEQAKKCILFGSDRVGDTQIGKVNKKRIEKLIASAIREAQREAVEKTKAEAKFIVKVAINKSDGSNNLKKFLHEGFLEFLNGWTLESVLEAE